MGVRRRTIRTALAVCALLCALPAHAVASHTQQSILMDDDQFIYSDASHTARALSEIKAPGVDRVKVSVVWSLVAPDAASTHTPKFDATNPAAYPPGAWARWDRIVTYARSIGLRVYFQLVPPAPLWALGKGKPAQGHPWSQKPSASDFGKFVEAVARRYSGSYVSTDAKDRPHPVADLPVTVPGMFPTAANPTPAIPKVDFWGVWNEPNEAAWLNPQWTTVRGRRQFDTAPAMYRHLVDAAYHASRVTGHASDTILIGELAARGYIYPIPFVQELYCLDSSNRPCEAAAPARWAARPPATGAHSATGTQACTCSPDSPTTRIRSTGRRTCRCPTRTGSRTRTSAGSSEHSTGRSLPTAIIREAASRCTRPSSATRAIRRIRM